MRSYDFIFERTEDGNTLKFLTTVDEFSRVAPSLSCGRSLTELYVVIRTLDTLLPVWGETDCLRSDNGSEFVAREEKKWLLEHRIGTHYIDPGSPLQKSIYRELQQHFQNDFLEPLVFLTRLKRLLKRLLMGWIRS